MKKRRCLLIGLLPTLTVLALTACRPAGTEGAVTVEVSASPTDVGPATSAAFACDGVSTIPRAECEALVALYENTDGPSWSERAGWLATADPCQWHGIVCEAGHVVQLDLIGNQLQGAIPSELGNLAGLNTLFLKDNRLGGSIPSELGNLTNLMVLKLSNNQLCGSIPPELGRLALLHQLDLSTNQLSGSIPAEIGNLVELNELKLSANQLVGAIPEELGNIGVMRLLIVAYNPLSGPLAEGLASLDNLYNFDFRETDLCVPDNPIVEGWLDSVFQMGFNGQYCDQ